MPPVRRCWPARRLPVPRSTSSGQRRTRPTIRSDPRKRPGIVTVEGSRIAFTHPLLALAVYRGAPSGQRRAAHRRLAEVVPDVEERARHLALASSEPDGQLAEVLDQAARRAHDRGAPGAAAELAELARRSTPPADLESRWRRGMEEAGFRFEAGDTGAARRLTQELRSAASPGSQRAEISHLMANLLWNDVNEIRGLLESVLAEASGDAALAAAHADMGVVELLGGHMRSGSQHGRRAIVLAERGDAPDALSLALVGTAYTEFLLGIDTVALLSRAAEVERRIAGRRSVSYVMTNAENLFGAEVLGAQLMWSGDIAGGRRVLERNYRDLVDRGQYTILWDCLVFLSELETRAGAFVRALEYAEEILEILDEAGYDKAREVGLWARSLAEAHLGLVDPARRDATEGLALAEQHGDLFHVITNCSVLGFLELSLGDFEASSRHLERLPELLASRGIVEPGVYPFVPDYVEALVGIGHLERAEEVLEPFERWGIELDRPLALATAARCRGLLAAAEHQSAALEHLGSAVELHGRLEQPFELARTELVLGTVQRRGRLKRTARESLGSALAIFDELGAPLWADKARAELARIGGRASAGDELTPSERRIAELVAEGKDEQGGRRGRVRRLSRRSRPTSTRIYAKLGVRSRAGLAHLMADDERP